MRQPEGRYIRRGSENRADTQARPKLRLRSAKSRSEHEHNPDQSVIPEHLYEKKPKAAPKAPKDKPLSHEEYMRIFGDQETIIELSDDNRWEVFRESVVRFLHFLRTAVSTGVGLVQRITPAPLRDVAHQLARVPQRVYERFGPLKTGVLASSLVIALIVGASLLASLSSSDTQGQVESAVDQQPLRERDFPIVQSETRSQSDAPVAFDPQEGVASFYEQVSGQTVAVSQQPLEEDQKTDSEAFLSQVAEDLGAEGSISTTKGVVYYIRSSARSSMTDTVMFIYNDLLIFVRSIDAQLPIRDWEEYIDSLL